MVGSHAVSLVFSLIAICPKSQIMPEPIEGEMYERSSANYGCKKVGEEKEREKREEEKTKELRASFKSAKILFVHGFHPFRLRQSRSYMWKKELCFFFSFPLRSYFSVRCEQAGQCCRTMESRMGNISRQEENR